MELLKEWLQLLWNALGTIGILLLGFSFAKRRTRRGWKFIAYEGGRLEVAATVFAILLSSQLFAILVISSELRKTIDVYSRLARLVTQP